MAGLGQLSVLGMLSAQNAAQAVPPWARDAGYSDPDIQQALAAAANARRADEVNLVLLLLK